MCLARCPRSLCVQPEVKSPVKGRPDWADTPAGPERGGGGTHRTLASKIDSIWHDRHPYMMLRQPWNKYTCVDKCLCHLISRPLHPTPRHTHTLCDHSLCQPSRLGFQTQIHVYWPMPLACDLASAPNTHFVLLVYLRSEDYYGSDHIESMHTHFEECAEYYPEHTLFPSIGLTVHHDLTW